MILLILFSSVLLCGVQCIVCPFNVKILQVLRNDGFHRNLSYVIDFASEDELENWLYMGCFVGLEQTLPSGLYATEDEPCKTQQIEVVFKTPVNIELPARSASPILMHIYTVVRRSKAYAHFLLHARYQHAVRGGGMARNEIPPPKLFLSCRESQLDSCDNLPALQTHVHGFCDNIPKEKCRWMFIPSIMLSNTIIWDVPVGNTDHYYVVAWGTSLVIVVGALYLLKNLHKYNFKVEKDMDKKIRL